MANTVPRLSQETPKKVPLLNRSFQVECPPGGPPLTETEIQLFVNWINQQETQDGVIQQEHGDEHDDAHEEMDVEHEDEEEHDGMDAEHDGEDEHDDDNNGHADNEHDDDN